MKAFSRRNFFVAAADESIALAQSFFGQPSFRLSDLSKLSDQELGTLIPIWANGVELVFDSFGIVAKVPTAGACLLLSDCHAKNHFIIRLIDGARSIADLASAASDQWGEPWETAFAEVRTLFLYLVSQSLCFPRNSPEDISA
jgi:hypothetical protein